MTFSEALILGIVQGVFMFLPVSSTSHLVLMQHWMIRRGSHLPAPESPEMIFFDLVVHVGTLFSIAVVFRSSLRSFLRRLWSDIGSYLKGDSSQEKLYLRLGLLGLFSVFITGAAGIPLKFLFEQVFARPAAIGVTLVITGILLYCTDIVPPRRRGLRGVTPSVAAVIGFGQAIALLPGISRSGTTIAFALFTGLKRRWAAKYSFFIAFPTIIAATSVQAFQVARLEEPIGVGAAELAAGFTVAAVVGIGALLLVLKLLYRANFRYFSYYVWALAAIVIYGAIRGFF